MSYNDGYIFASSFGGFNNMRDKGLPAKRLHYLWQISVHSGSFACCKDDSMNIQRNDELSLIQVPYLFFLNF